MDQLRPDEIRSLARVARDGLPRLGAGRRILYHGSREGLAGRVRASEDGSYGPGLYLPSLDRARDYARHDPSVAADLALSRRLPKVHPGVIYACDVTGLRFLELASPDAYHRLLELLRNHREISDPLARMLVQAMLESRGYDGIEVTNLTGTETLVFPGRVPQLRLGPV